MNLQPLIAATEVPPENKSEHDGKKPEGDNEKAEGESKKPRRRQAARRDRGAGLRRRRAGGPHRLDAEGRGATGMAALASVQAQQQVWVGEGVVRTRATLGYAISRAELPQLSIDVPADQKVLNVFDANVRGWSVKAADGKQRITADLFEPAKASQQVVVELEKFLPGSGDQRD